MKSLKYVFALLIIAVSAPPGNGALPSVFRGAPDTHTRFIPCARQADPYSRVTLAEQPDSPPATERTRFVPTGQKTRDILAQVRLFLRTAEQPGT